MPSDRHVVKLQPSRREGIRHHNGRTMFRAFHARRSAVFQTLANKDEQEMTACHLPFIAGFMLEAGAPDLGVPAVVEGLR